jgi:ABC-type transport system substrate-binding protein
VRGLRIFDTGPSSATYVAWLNQNMKTDPVTRESYIPAFRLQWFFDARFRHAMSLLFNREDIVNSVFQGKAVPAAGLISPAESRWWPGLQPDSFSPVNARQLLTESGFTLNTSVTPNALYGSNRSPVQFTITVLTGDAFAERIGTQAERIFASLGIKATLVSLPYDLFYQKINSTYDYDMALMLLEQPVHPYFLKELMSWSSSGHVWYPEQDAPATPPEREMAAALATLYGSADWNERYDAVHKLEQYNAQSRYLLPVVKPHGLFGAKGKVQNLQVNHRCMSLMWNLEEIYVQE